MDEQFIENKQITTTAKSLVWFIGGILSLMITILATYYSLKSVGNDNARDLRELKKNGEIRDIQLESLRNDIQAIRLEIAVINQQLKK